MMLVDAKDHLLSCLLLHDHLQLPQCDYQLIGRDATPMVLINRVKGHLRARTRDDSLQHYHRLLHRNL